MRAPNPHDGALDDLRSEEPYAFWRLLARYAPGQWHVLALGIVSGMGARAFEILPAFLIGISLDMIFFREAAFALPGLPQAWVPATATGELLLVGGLIGAAYVGAAGLEWVNRWSWNLFSQTMQHKARTDTYAAMQTLDMSFFDSKQTGELMSVLNNDVNRLERFLTDGVNMGFRIVVMIGGMALVMLLINWQLALIPVLFIPVLALASWWFMSIIYPKYQDVRSVVARLNSRLENNVGGIETVKAYRQEAFEEERVTRASKRYYDSNWDAITTRIKFFPSLRVITAAGFLSTFFVGGWWVLYGAPWILTGTLSAGMLVTFLLYTRTFMYPMHEFGRIVNDHQYAEAASERVLGLFERTPTILDAPDAYPLESLDETIRFDHVTFAYPTDEAPVLDDVNITIQAGETIGLVGPTGSGKTTLAKLLMRFYDPTEGHVRVGPHDLREATLESLRSNIGYVRQDPYLFYGTVKENISYAVPQADQAAVERAARRAGAQGFIQDLPDGYETMVGERGVRLSGGQRQRIALARALLADPDILILDEATSHVDNETEAIIQQRLGEITQDRTTLVIAHRLSTVRDADRILVLEDGRILEEDTHDALLENDGLYARLWNVQAGNGPPHEAARDPAG